MIKHIQPLPVSAATGFVSEMYKQIRRDFGFVGDIFIMHSLSPPLLAGVWAALRETEIVGAVPRGIKEAVAAAVAKANQCSFCVDAHTTMLSAAGNKEAAQKIIEDQADGISDEKMRSIVKWALALVFSSSIRKSRKPGESIVFLSEAILPNDLRWASPIPS